MKDYKYSIQLKAEELAWEWFEQDFYTLPQQVQHEIYALAEQQIIDSLASYADSLKDRYV